MNFQLFVFILFLDPPQGLELEEEEKHPNHGIVPKLLQAYLLYIVIRKYYCKLISSSSLLCGKPLFIRSAATLSHPIWLLELQSAINRKGAKAMENYQAL